MTARAGLRRRCVALALLAVSCLSVHAAPVVEGLDLVLTTRVDRTVFDYTYRLRIRGDLQDYSNASITVKSRSPSTMVMKPLVQIGRIDAAAFARTSDTLVIRQDRTAPFSFDSLLFSFAGIAVGPDLKTGLTFGPLAVVEQGGRPLHEGAFLVQSDNPVVGSQLLVRATVVGPVQRVTFQLRNDIGTVLAFGPMEKMSDELQWYGALITVPNDAFAVTVVATTDSGAEAQWTSSRKFVPAGFSIKVEPSKALMQKNESVPGSITIRSTSATGPHVVSLLLASGVVGNVGPWQVNLTPGAVTRIPISFTAPSDGAAFQALTIGARAQSTSTPSKPSEANVRIVVE